MTALVAVQTAILALLCVLVLGLLRAYATVLRRLHELEGGGAPPFRTVAGVPSPGRARTGGNKGADKDAVAGNGADIAGTGLAGEIAAVRVIDVEHDTVLAFLSSGCTACGAFWEELADPASLGLPLGARLLVITRDPDEESPAMLAQLCPPGLDLIQSSAAWEDYAVPGSPYVAVVHGPSGRVLGAGSAASMKQLAGLMAQAFGDTAELRGGARAVVKPAADRERELDVDRELLAAGITPGDPRLYDALDTEPHQHGNGRVRS